LWKPIGGPFGFSWFQAQLAAKALVYGHWKSLDFLGFSRPNQAFSMGCAGFSLEEISLALLPGEGLSAGTGASHPGMQKR
jgi:hypothetical protein